MVVSSTQFSYVHISLRNLTDQNITFIFILPHNILILSVMTPPVHLLFSECLPHVYEQHLPEAHGQ